MMPERRLSETARGCLPCRYGMFVANGGDPVLPQQARVQRTHTARVICARTERKRAKQRDICP